MGGSDGYRLQFAICYKLLQMIEPESRQTGAVERSLKAEIKLYYDLHKPAVLPAPLLIALHGYGANKRQMMREAQQMAPENFAIASLQGFHQHMKEPKEPGGPLRFGFGWLTNFHPEESVAIHHQALLDLMQTLISEGVADPKRMFLLGFSQTCALNYRFAFTHPDHLRGVIGICGGLPGRLGDERKLQTNQGRGASSCRNARRVLSAVARCGL